jgi:sRNA-binding protein
MSGKNAERLRGLKESRAAIERLRSLWPAAFPAKFKLVKPLKAGAVTEIVERTGWTHDYARGVLQGWKMRAAYCEAVLREPLRIDLNGKPLTAPVDEEARAMARTRLAVLAARQAKEQQRQAERQRPA